jgi:RNA polymerase sigma-70 factor (ECF subfamily)
VEETAADPAMAADEQMMQDEFRLQVQRAVAMLPEPAKSALILTEIEGLSHAAAAEILGITPKAVEGRVARARKKLTASLVSHVHDEEMEIDTLQLSKPHA